MTKGIEMSNQKVYGPWIEWHGGECPVPPETIVEVKFRNGTIEPIHAASEYSWIHIAGGGDIVEYRIVTEQADLEADAQAWAEFDKWCRGGGV